MTSPYHCVSLAPGDGKKRDPENEVGLTYNLVRRVSFLPAPYSKRETLVGDGHDGVYHNMGHYKYNMYIIRRRDGRVKVCPFMPNLHAN